jgi:aminoglycoside 3-N-acetyltransferase I
VSLVIHHLTPDDIPLMEALSAIFGEAFDDVDTCTGNRPSADYLRPLPGGDSFIALAALRNSNVVCGIAPTNFKSLSENAAKSASTTWPFQRRTGAKESQRP